MIVSSVLLLDIERHNLLRVPSYDVEPAYGSCNTVRDRIGNQIEVELLPVHLDVPNDRAVVVSEL